MTTDPRSIPVVPNARIPWILGLLNIIFASGLLLCGLCNVASSLLSPMFMKGYVRTQQQAQEEAQAKRERELKELDEQEKAAATEDEKAQVQAMRRQIQSSPVSAPPVFDPQAFATPRLRIWNWTEIVSVFLLNGLMLASGIGLLRCKSWARKLWMGTAIVKIVRLVLMWGFFALVLVPEFTPKLSTFMSGALAPPAGGRPLPPALTPARLTQTYIIIYSIMSFGMIVAGSIYPVVSLWLLRQRSVVAACEGAKPALAAEEGEFA